MTLQEEIDKFVDTWGPDHSESGLARGVFVDHLYRLLRLYAANAILKLGAQPEKKKRES